MHHVDGKENPTDEGTRPELITPDSVRPGSIWLCGKDWMKLPVNQAQEAGIIKTVEDIKLSNEKKKVFKEGIAYDTFDDTDQGIFALARIEETDHRKMFQRQEFSKYLYLPLKRSFKSLVRITAVVLLAVAKFKKWGIKRRIREGRLPRNALKTVDFLPAKFKIFHQEWKSCSTLCASLARAVFQTYFFC